MSGKHKKQFGIWMDTHHATIVGREHVDSGDFIVLAHEENPGYTRTSNEHAKMNADITLMHKFFKAITTHMQNAEEVHVTGTGQVQEEFIHHLADTAQFKHAVAYDSTTNKMSDEKLIEFMTEKFN